ncbi:uncharacterized protein DUF993 [Hoeflea marina]|uniref:Uncharacterized protein DUF993 n=1 Tax=Hoeflea marina TaxID=274592 RepID=A0A317PV55_9HYPH|nr:dihydrodipicolinate synthase family protein [Hoeflea marina]PWW04565.1 uncharacterized protein DUF993 [Hoeflea marina]
MRQTLSLPGHDRSLSPYALTGTPPTLPANPPRFNRQAYAAAHVVSDPFAERTPWGHAAIDWDATLAFRHHLWSLGFSVAEAMDTAQRGMGVNWEQAAELIRRSVAESRSVSGAGIACGAGTDHLDPVSARSLDDVIAAYETQFEVIESCGGRTIVMASRALARLARSADDYRHVYGRILSQAREPVILHWLGDMFDPQLAGYWGADRFEDTLETVLSIINAHPGKVAGIKISLLEAGKEIALRDRLPEGVVCFTGDDFNYAEMIEGDVRGHSHALLGIFDAIAPNASSALAALARGDVDDFRAILAPTVPLSRKIFEAPTQYYKAGIVFLAWLNGHQDHFTMPGGMQSARGIVHYAEIFRLADRAGALARPDLAVERMRVLLATAGVA